MKWDNIDTALLPSFLVIGTMKGGTTSLHNYLSQHPDIFMSVIKEPGLFLDYPQYVVKARDYYGKDISTRLELVQLMREGMQDEREFGETSTYYTKIPFQGKEAPAHIAEARPDMKFVYLVRNPLERIMSHYFHTIDQTKGYSQSFNDFIKTNGKLVLMISLYHFQLSHYLKYFSGKQFLVIGTDELRETPVRVLKKIFSFLDIDTGFVPENLSQRFNVSKSKKNIGNADDIRMSRQTYNQLMKFILPDMKNLEKITGRSFSDWDLSEDRWC